MIFAPFVHVTLFVEIRIMQVQITVSLEIPFHSISLISYSSISFRLSHTGIIHNSLLREESFNLLASFLCDFWLDIDIEVIIRVQIYPQLLVFSAYCRTLPTYTKMIL